MPTPVRPTHDKNRHLEILQALAAGTDPITGKVFTVDSPYNQPEIIRACPSLNELRAVAEKGNQGLTWTEEEDELPAERFSKGTKITQLAKIHSQTYGASTANQTWIATEITKPSILLLGPNYSFICNTIVILNHPRHKL